MFFSRRSSFVVIVVIWYLQIVEYHSYSTPDGPRDTKTFAVQSVGALSRSRMVRWISNHERVIGKGQIAAQFLDD